MHVYPPSRRLRVHQIKEPSRVGRGDFPPPPCKPKTLCALRRCSFFQLVAVHKYCQTVEAHPCPSFALVETLSDAVIGVDSSSRAFPVRKKKVHNQAKNEKIKQLVHSKKKRNSNAYPITVGHGRTPFCIPPSEEEKRSAGDFSCRFAKKRATDSIEVAVDICSRKSSSLY